MDPWGMKGMKGKGKGMLYDEWGMPVDPWTMKGKGKGKDAWGKAKSKGKGKDAWGMGGGDWWDYGGEWDPWGLGKGKGKSSKSPPIAGVVLGADSVKKSKVDDDDSSSSSSDEENEQRESVSKMPSLEPQVEMGIG